MNDIVQKVRTKYEQGNPGDAQCAAIDAAQDATSDELLLLGALAKQYSDYEAANAAYAKLVEETPENPDYRNHYAMTLTQSGQFDAAEKQLNAALSLNDAHAHSYFNLSMIRRATADDALIANLEDHLRVVDISPADNYAYRLALGKFYDDVGDYDNAFAQFDAAKKSAAINYDHNSQQAFFERLKSAYTPEYIKENSGGGDPSEAPIFIVGMPRSGSSLVEKMLAQDTRIKALGERIEMTSVVEALVSRLGREQGYLDQLPSMSLEEFKRCGADYCGRLTSLSMDAERFTDKNVLNFLRAGFINLILPNATIIHAQRNPIDICLSCYFQTFDPAIFPFTFDLSDLGKYFALYADLMSHWDSVIPQRIFNIDYEKIIVDAEGSITTLIEKTNLSLPPQLESGDAQKAMIATSSAWQARQPIYETSVERWKNYEKHLSPLFEALDTSGFHYAGE